MKIADELKGKEVIDAAGNKVGEISDAEWSPQTNRVESLIVTEGGASAKLGMGKKIEIPYSEIKTIGEKVLLNGTSKSESVEEPPSIEEIKRREEEI
ncbi:MULTISPECIES: PRC-barrel domain-containing protein [Methanobacterium]|jgi:sporulation protein YlmC with PRC-barrel domain|uniref:PRC-barrel domain-containing protein n=1 Tax=Methanobacterium veterum TaxID=408577 RepID=A0A9E5DMD8_9EURY|nr:MULTISPECIES: PRC-barrel domain-containing protein [Methanobacterium]MCZ3364965.1 PRC-barrel domain-containing protein [Methanobacterium veterum]MCZ3372720.1 PRC-barrel domain-containing protein [Methanobacterium veterum]